MSEERLADIIVLLTFLGLLALPTIVVLWLIGVLGLGTCLIAGVATLLAVIVGMLIVGVYFAD